MRLPVVQFILFLYSLALVAISIKLNRRSIWLLTVITLASLIFNTVLLFINSSQGISLKRGLMSAPAQILGAPFAFFLLPLFLSIEALITRHKYIVMLAVASVGIPIIFVILLSYSAM